MPRRAVQIGEGGRTLGNLRPGGVVEVGGFRYQARSTGSFIPDDTPVIVEQVEPTCLIVRPQCPGDTPLIIREDHDERGRQEHEARLREFTHRRRLHRELLTVLVLGMGTGVLLGVALNPGPALLSFAAWGTIAGAVYLAYLRLFLLSAHELVSEAISPRPGPWLLIVTPLTGAALGAVGGFDLFGERGAILGSVALAFLLPPLLCLAWRLLVTLLETP